MGHRRMLLNLAKKIEVTIKVRREFLLLSIGYIQRNWLFFVTYVTALLFNLQFLLYFWMKFLTKKPSIFAGGILSEIATIESLQIPT